MIYFFLSFSFFFCLSFFHSSSYEAHTHIHTHIFDNILFSKSDDDDMNKWEGSVRWLDVVVGHIHIDLIRGVSFGKENVEREREPDFHTPLTQSSSTDWLTFNFYVYMLKKIAPFIVDHIKCVVSWNYISYPSTSASFLSTGHSILFWCYHFLHYEFSDECILNAY